MENETLNQAQCTCDTDDVPVIFTFEELGKTIDEKVARARQRSNVGESFDDLQEAKHYMDLLVTKFHQEADSFVGEVAALVHG